MKHVFWGSLLALVFSAQADMGAIPLVKGKISESKQDAIILYDHVKQRETIVLQTEIHANYNVDALFFMPLPSKPTVSLAPADIFKKVGALTDKHKMSFFHTDVFMKLSGPGGQPNVNGGLKVVLQKRIGNHDVTVVKIESPKAFVKWVLDFVEKKKIKTMFNFIKVNDLVKKYVQDDVKYFLFDKVSVKIRRQTMKPLVIDFKSSKVYYPLRVNSLYHGPSDVQIMLFSPTRIPGYRFTKIGFMRTKQIVLTARELTNVWDEFGKRWKGPVNFQCYKLWDPRSLFKEFDDGDMLIMEKRPSKADLVKDAKKRWSRDVRIDMRWGKRFDPNYEFSQWTKWTEGHRDMLNIILSGEEDE